MGFLDALFNPTRHTNSGYNTAISGFKDAQNTVNPYYESLLSNAGGANSLLADLLGLNGPGAQQTAMNNYSTSPGYEAQLAQGTKAIDQSAAARGMNRSGATLKALQGYGQDLYNQDYGNYLSRLAGLSSGGAVGASGITGNAQALGQLQIGRGNARDAGNQASFGNIVGLGGTILGTLAGFPTGGSGGSGGRIRFN